MSLFHRRRGPVMPAEFEPLARYNAEVARGIAHTDERRARMAELQERFNDWSRRTAPPNAFTAICAHCGRPMGDYAGGFASVPVDGQSRPVCHPNDPDRPDCYRLVTVYHEPLGSRKEQR